MPGLAQPVPANDGTGTRVIPTGDQFDISGGQLSRDRANLFHSFQRFGLSREQIVNFLSNPETRNILARVVGGDASYINGLLQVTGGSANLLLMNPSGIVFGTNARLNLPGDFTATTANGISFGSGWFNAIGANDYANLVGIPTAFAFTMNQPGAIFNAGALAVGQGHTLNLTAGTIISPGPLTASGGQIVVTTVPGQNTVRIRQPGNILQLEVKPLATGDGRPNTWSFPILALPDLLTGASKEEISGMELDQSNQVKLTGSDLKIQNGDIAARNLTTRTATLSAARDLVLVESHLQTTGDLTLRAQNTVIARDSVAKPFVARTGGNLNIQGNQSIDILALNHPTQTPFQSNGDLSLVSDGTISGDAHFASGGNFSILNLSGNPGTFISLYDPIISSSGDVVFGNYTGVALKVEARGSITSGDIRITGPDTMLSGFDPDIPALTSSPTLILRAGLDVLDNQPNTPQSQGTTSFTASGQVSLGQITVGNIDTSSLTTEGGPVVLSAKGNITTGNIRTNSGSGNGAQFFISTKQSLIEKKSKQNEFIRRNFNPGDLVSTASRTLTRVTRDANGKETDSEFLRGRIFFISGGERNDLIGNGGNITISSSSGGVRTGDVLSFANSRLGNGGDININSTTSIQTNNLNSTALGDGNGGSITLTSRSGNIQSGNIFSLSSFSELSRSPSSFLITASGNGGAISLSAQKGRIDTGNISSVAYSGGGGEIRINALDDVRANDVTSGAVGTRNLRGGDITINSSEGSISAGTLFTETPNDAGSISLTAADAIDIKRIFVSKGSNLFLQASEIQVNQVAADFSQTDLTLVGVSVSVVIPDLLTTVITQVAPDKVTFDPVQKLEQRRQEEFEQYFGLGKSFRRSFIDSKYISYALEESEKSNSDNKAAVVYVYFEDDQLKLHLITAKGKHSMNVENQPKREDLRKAIEALNREIQNSRDPAQKYKDPAQKLYEWIVSPLEKTLVSEGITTLLFSMDSGLRLIPLASLYDGKKHLVENYNFSIIPNFKSTDIRYTNLKNAQVLAMGASEFSSDSLLSPLPSVPVELAIAAKSPSGEQFPITSFLNENFTLDTLRTQRRHYPFQIVHLATHVDFSPGDPGNSSIQLGDNTKLRLNPVQLRLLQWGDPPIDLLVLSACRTALGSNEAELGFAGLSLQSGVKSTLASLWNVSDLASLVLMKEFYRQLRNGKITKANALQEAQKIMLANTNKVVENNLKELGIEIKNVLGQEKNRNLSPSFSDDTKKKLEEMQKLLESSETQREEIAKRLRSPFYWAAFTIVGSPW